MNARKAIGFFAFFNAVFWLTVFIAQRTELFVLSQVSESGPLTLLSIPAFFIPYLVANFLFVLSAAIDTKPVD